MKVTFLGDVSVIEHPREPVPCFSFLKESDLVIANLEGAIAATPLSARQLGSAVYSTRHVLEVLRAHNVTAVSLANNHIFDLPQSIVATVDELQKAGISSFGAGPTISSASAPLIERRDGQQLEVYGFGWDVIGCRGATARRSGVNPLTPRNVFQTVKKIRADDPSSFVVFLMHWNYELELYPQPAHRQLALDLLRDGVSAVVGVHSHVACGAELVDGRLAAYGLGNWYFPPRKMGRLQISYPEAAEVQLALVLDTEGPEIAEAQFNWVRFNPTSQQLNVSVCESWGGDTIRQLTPYAGMSHREYQGWFRTHRRRRKGLPVYADYRHTVRNRSYDAIVRLRTLAIEAAVKAGLKTTVNG